MFSLAVPEQKYPSYDRFVDAGKRAFAERHSTVSGARRFATSVGLVECVEARTGPTSLDADCLSRDSGLDAMFLGDAADLPKFYHAVETVRIVRSK